MLLAVNGHFQKAGGAECLPDGVVARISVDEEVSGRGVKEEANRRECAVLQAFEPQAGPPDEPRGTGCSARKQARPDMT
jgi:hypothetical protein